MISRRSSEEREAGLGARGKWKEGGRKTFLCNELENRMETGDDRWRKRSS